MDKNKKTRNNGSVEEKPEAPVIRIDIKILDPLYLAIVKAAHKADVTPNRFLAELVADHFDMDHEKVLPPKRRAGRPRNREPIPA